MQMWRETNVDDIDLRQLDQRFERLGDVQTLQRYLLSRRPKVPLDPAPIPSSLFGVLAGKGDQVCKLRAPVSQRMDPAHKANSDEADVDPILVLHGVSLEGKWNFKCSETKLLAINPERDSNSYRGWLCRPRGESKHFENVLDCHGPEERPDRHWSLAAACQPS